MQESALKGPGVYYIYDANYVSNMLRTIRAQSTIIILPLRM